MSSEKSNDTRAQADAEGQQQQGTEAEGHDKSVDINTEEDGRETPASEQGEDLQGQLDKSREEAERYKDMALRAEAEMQNIQRRAERDVANAHKYGLEKFVQNLLPVVDSLEKAIEAAEQSDSQAEQDAAILEGVRLCHKLFLDVLEKHNAEVVDPEGEPFDPNEHEAMSMVENAEMDPNSVVSVIQKGYKINGRLIRPAMVMVSKAPAVKESGDE
ncbi:MAG: nucleotide exchange factor GrpE [Pseudomonadales bacterium]